MPNTRRQFLHATVGMAAGFAGAAPFLASQTKAGRVPLDSISDAQIKVPRVRFGTADISRLILGVNPFYGFGHYNAVLDTVMRE